MFTPIWLELPRSWSLSVAVYTLNNVPSRALSLDAHKVHASSFFVPPQAAEYLRAVLDLGICNVCFLLARYTFFSVYMARWSIEQQVTNLYYRWESAVSRKWFRSSAVLIQIVLTLTTADRLLTLAWFMMYSKQLDSIFWYRYKICSTDIKV